jgi:hypothetical protein
MFKTLWQYFQKFQNTKFTMYFWKILYLYLNKYLEHTKSDIKKLFVVKATCIFW